MGLKQEACSGWGVGRVLQVELHGLSMSDASLPLLTVQTLPLLTMQNLHRPCNAACADRAGHHCAQAGEIYNTVLSHTGDESPWVIDAHLYYDADTSRLWMTWGGHNCWITELHPTSGRVLNPATGDGGLCRHACSWLATPCPVHVLCILRCSLRRMLITCLLHLACQC